MRNCRYHIDIVVFTRGESGEVRLILNNKERQKRYMSNQYAKRVRRTSN